MQAIRNALDAKGYRIRDDHVFNYGLRKRKDKREVRLIDVGSVRPLGEATK